MYRSKYVEDDCQTLAGFISNFLENSIVQRLKISRVQKLVVSALNRNFL